MSETDPDDPNKAEDPSARYEPRKWKIRSFNSFEEAADAEAKEAAQISGLEHLRNSLEITKRVFAEALKKPLNKKIKIRDLDERPAA